MKIAALLAVLSTISFAQEHAQWSVPKTPAVTPGGAASAAASYATTNGTNKQQQQQSQRTNQEQSVSTGSTNSGNTDIEATSKFIPSMQPQIPFTPIAGSSIVEIPLTCGPLQRVVHSEVTGVMAGLFRTKKFINGTTDDLAPYLNEQGIVERFHRETLDDGRNGYRLFGHQPFLLTAVIGIAGGRSIGGGGTTANQASGQLGLGGTSSVQQVVVKILLRDCEYGTVVYNETPQPVYAVPRVITPPFVIPASEPLATLSPTIVPHVKKKRKSIPACVPGAKQ